VATFVLRGHRLIDGSGDAPREGDDATVVVDAERIESVGGRTPSLPQGDDVDLTGLTVLPGLIDAHVHLTLVDLADEEGKKTPAAVMAAKIFHVCKLTLDAGFTTVRDAGGADGGIAQVTASGLLPGPRIYPSGPLIVQTGGHGDLRLPWDHHSHGVHGVPGLFQISTLVDGPDAARKAAREHFRRGATQLKVCVSGGVVSLTDSLEDTQLSVDELRAVVEEAEARHTYVLAHAHNNAGIRNALAAGVRSIEHATFLDDETAQEIVAAGAYVVPTLAVAHLMINEWREWGLTEEIAARMSGIEEAMSNAVRIAYMAGIPLGSGSDLLGPEQNRRGLEIVLKARLIGAMNAIVSATRTNAELMGLADEVGTVTAGNRADVVAFDGNPLDDPWVLDDPDRCVFVMQGGKVVKDLRR
jgi:imidazolonepropionase-like amidohydrolase